MTVGGVVAFALPGVALAAGAGLEMSVLLLLVYLLGGCLMAWELRR